MCKRGGRTRRLEFGEASLKHSFQSSYTEAVAILSAPISGLSLLSAINSIAELSVDGFVGEVIAKYEALFDPARAFLFRTLGWAPPDWYFYLFTLANVATAILLLADLEWRRRRKVNSAFLETSLEATRIAAEEEVARDRHEQVGLSDEQWKEIEEGLDALERDPKQSDVNISKHMGTTSDQREIGTVSRGIALLANLAFLGPFIIFLSSHMWWIRQSNVLSRQLSALSETMSELAEEIAELEKVSASDMVERSLASHPQETIDAWASMADDIKDMNLRLRRGAVNAVEQQINNVKINRYALEIAQVSYRSSLLRSTLFVVVFSFGMYMFSAMQN
jgi:hypothetical protein